MPNRLDHAEEIYALIGDWISNRDLATVEEAFTGAGVPCAPVLNVEQIFEHPMIQGRGSIVDVPWQGQDLAMVDVLPRLSESPGQIRSAAPRRGEHTVAVLEEAGIDRIKLIDLASRGIIGISEED